LRYYVDSDGLTKPTPEFQGVISLATLLDQLGIVRCKNPKMSTRVAVGKLLRDVFMKYRLGTIAEKP
jgi:hypothetical protein